MPHTHKKQLLNNEVEEARVLQLEAAARIPQPWLEVSASQAGFLQVPFPSFAWSITFPDDWENLLCAVPAELLAGGFPLLTYHSRAVRCVNCTLQLCQMNFQLILVPSYYYLCEYYFPWTAEVSEGRELELLSQKI